MALLSIDEINSKLGNLTGWNYSDNHIHKEFKLKDFISALDFVNRIGTEAERMDHHPDIFIHSYNEVKISISTHSEGGVTEKDFSLAGKIESLIQ